MPMKDLRGKKFGRLTAMHLTSKANDGATRWLCTCECGNTKEVRRSDLTSGKSQSCGCRQAYGARNMQKRIDDLEVAIRTIYSYSIYRSGFASLSEVVAKMHHDLFPELHKHTKEPRVVGPCCDTCKHEDKHGSQFPCCECDLDVKVKNRWEQKK